MPNPTTIQVPLATTGKVARVTLEIDLLFGDKKPTDANEALAFGTGGKFTGTVNADGTIDFAAVSTTLGDTDTVTVTDDEETITLNLVVADDSAVGLEEEGVEYADAKEAAGSEAGGTV